MIFVLAIRRRPTKRENNDELTLNFSVEIGAVSKDPVRKTSPKILSSSNRSFQLPVHADDALLRRAISTSIATLEIPFLRGGEEKSILWGALDFPKEGQTPPPLFQNLDEIKSSLCHVARTCVDTGYMYVVIRKLDRVSPEDYQKLLEDDDEGENNKKSRGQPLGVWIRENANDVNLIRFMEILHQLSRHSPADNKYFGLRSVRVEEERGEHEGCSICLKGLNKGSEVIRMPCSHLFHGFCILRWIRRNSSCPFCRYDLKIDRRLLLEKI